MPATKAKLAGAVWRSLGQLVTPGPAGPAGPQGPIGSGGFPLVGRVPFTLGAEWTWLNQGTSTVATAEGAARFGFQNAAAENLRAFVKPIPPTGTPTYSAAFLGSPVTGGNYQLIGVTLYETVSGKFASGFLQNGTIPVWRKNTNATTFSSGGQPWPGGSYLRWPAGPFYVQAYLTATQYGFRWSIDGVFFDQLLTQENFAAWFTGRPDRVGFVALVLDPAPTAYATFLSWSES